MDKNSKRQYIKHYSLRLCQLNWGSAQRQILLSGSTALVELSSVRSSAVHNKRIAVASGLATFVAIASFGFDANARFAWEGASAPAATQSVGQSSSAQSSGSLPPIAAPSGVAPSGVGQAVVPPTSPPTSPPPSPTVVTGSGASWVLPPADDRRAVGAAAPTSAGSPPLDAPTSSFGRDLPIDVAIAMIAPRGTTVVFSGGAARSTLVSWENSQSSARWQDTLRSVFQRVGLQFKEDGASLVVSPLPGGAVSSAAPVGLPRQIASLPTQVPAPATAQVAVPASPSPSGTRPESTPASLVNQAPALSIGVAQPSNRPWVASVGSTLRRTLDGWAKDAGWNLAWQSDRDYPLIAGGSFDGSFERAVIRLFEGFADSDPPVRATMHRANKVIVVRTQADVLQTEY
jgi:hypothetical protein